MSAWCVELSTGPYSFPEPLIPGADHIAAAFARSRHRGLCLSNPANIWVCESSLIDAGRRASRCLAILGLVAACLLKGFQDASSASAPSFRHAQGKLVCLGRPLERQAGFRSNERTAYPEPLTPVECCCIAAPPHKGFSTSEWRRGSGPPGRHDGFASIASFAVSASYPLRFGLSHPF